MHLAMRSAAVLLVIVPFHLTLAQTTVKPRPENGKLKETTTAKDAEVTIQVTDANGKIIDTDRFPRTFGLGTENSNGPSILIMIPDKVGAVGGSSTDVIDVSQKLKILKNSGETSDLSIESMLLDPSSGTYDLVNIFGTLEAHRIFDEVLIPDLFGDTNNDGVLDDGDDLFSLVNLDTYLNAVPTFSFGDSFSIVNGATSALPGMMFSTTPFTFDPATGFSDTPYTGTGVAEGEHGVTVEPVPEPSTLALVGIGLFGLAAAVVRISRFAGPHSEEQ